LEFAIGRPPTGHALERMTPQHVRAFVIAMTAIMAVLVIALVCSSFFPSETSLAKVIPPKPQFPPSAVPARSLDSPEEAEDPHDPTSPVVQTAISCYAYNAKGQLALIRYADGSTYTYSYNQYGDKINETYHLKMR
jgi:YD repeat-containing protein